ncbi:class I SAM-dependent methyltransferase [Cognatishimia sp. SS12]|uniref:class I SAM-dependent methyltransferase n=1 Tax=Cognatishimia sp. SS12 TaxID=2979465 RepID=UPI00232ED4DA|nr:class I SAM-dependent methyltransferase [Cognatishimia sp. SS12]MDC0739130.1 class I SAM-dependent methyltransferase [Cognatishimia sp. SS12]
MLQSRLSLAAEGGQFELPAEGRIAVYAPPIGMDLSALPKERCLIIQRMKPAYDAYEAAGYDVAVAAEGTFSAAVVFLPRSKSLGRTMIAEAAAQGGLVIVDGQKTDGVESFLKDCKRRSAINGALSKAHGKLFCFTGGDYADWAATEPAKIDGRFAVAPGVFSADGVDPASALLAEALPGKLGKTVADLGCGWGFLTQQILTRSDVETLYAVEADHVALTCAKQNVTDPRAAFHWADATTWEARAQMNAVVMNPPFHTGRKAEPDLGRAFISAAAAMLMPTGQLWMVANRHLPYEQHLQDLFAKVEEVAGDNRFKILHAQRPSRAKR